MGIRSFVAAVVLFAASATLAIAGDYGDHRGDRYADHIIVVHDNGREYRIDRHDRSYDRVTQSPFQFRLGHTYDYTNRCRHGQCQVLVYGPYSRNPIGRLWAPHIERMY